MENSAYRLATNIKKTQKRANALKNITIPMYTNLVHTISNALEGKERRIYTVEGDKEDENVEKCKIGR